jgi:hypothetical protein
LHKELTMAEQCEYLEKCGFFLNYEDREKARQCERRKIREQSGQPPADNMCPTGKLLWG